MLGTETEAPRDSLHLRNNIPPRSTLPPFGRPQGSPVSIVGGQGTSTLEAYKSWFPENNRARSATTGVPPRPFPSANEFGHPRFGPPLLSGTSQSPQRANTTDANSPTNSSPFPYRKSSLTGLEGSVPNKLVPRAGIDDSPLQYAHREPPITATSSEAQGARLGSDFGSRISRPAETVEQGQPVGPQELVQKAHQEAATEKSAGGAGMSNYPFLSRPLAQPSPTDQRLQSGSERTHINRAVDSISQDRQNSLSPEFHRHSRESQFAALRHLQEPRRISRGTPDSAEQSRDSQLSHLQRQLVASAAGIEEASGPDHNRKLLGLLSENRRGRVSPLPQAVQGAQAQLRGPASEPGIKNEFARMFSGIGSGVGSTVSTPVPPDNQPPLSIPSSPLGLDEGDRRTPLNRKADISDSKRNASRPGRKRTKNKDDEIKKEADGENSTNLARTLSGRGPKRARNNYQNTPASTGQS